MDVSDLNKYFFEENSKINVIANRILAETKKNVNKDNLKYLNFFNKNEIPKIVINYYFLILLSMTNTEMLFDSNNLLNGEILNNHFNNFISEESLLLLFLKIKIYCASEFNKIIPKKEIIQNILEDKINKYENLFEYEQNDLLLKNIEIEKRTELLFLEIKKLQINNLSFQLILSYYFFKFEIDNNIDNFKQFTENVEKITDLFIKNSLNSSLDEFWNHLITNI
jgi:hypothetical protein